MNDHFVRMAENPGGVINTDNRGLAAYKLQKQKNKQLDRLQEKVEQLDQLADEVSEIKALLKTIVEKI